MSRFCDAWPWHLLPEPHADPAGSGQYNFLRSIFGFCYPATFGVDQVVASATTYKMGVNAAAGLELPLGPSHLKAFGEAHYSRMFTRTVRISNFFLWFGIRWSELVHKTLLRYR